MDNLKDKNSNEEKSQSSCLCGVGVSFIERAMLVIDDYLNAGDKETRQEAAYQYLKQIDERLSELYIL